MVTADEIRARRDVISGSRDLQGLLAHLRAAAQPLIERAPAFPEHKALLSTDGGMCADDGAVLIFDPWSPDRHRCPRCGKTWTGERHERNWSRYQHLWLAERAAHLAALAALDPAGAPAAAERARQILNTYAERYWHFPNRDNLLGPSRLFFSTYLESIWICNLLSAAMLLRGADLLDEGTTRGVHQVVEEAATLIGDYDEQFSNRQTWNNAALTAVAVWFEDEELAQRAIEGPTGLIQHVGRGFGRDGMWYEGENYHLFALRGALTAAGWARLAGVDFAEDPRLYKRLAAALRAPALTALPDFTFPARKDTWYGVSLAQPAHLELWEVGLARLQKEENGALADVASWLAALYEAPPAPRELLESYLHDAPVDRTPQPAARAALSWWSLLEALPELPAAEPWNAPSVLLESQGVAIFRAGTRYAGLECGQYGGGHGHPDRLHLTLYADGVHWLADPGTGSYVSRDLFWYRSTLAHNAPRLDGASQESGNAVCECYEAHDDWGWARGQFGDLERTVAIGARYLIDVVDLGARDEHLLELPWHIAGSGDVATGGRWVTGELVDEFVTRVEKFLPDAPGPIRLLHEAKHQKLSVHLVVEGELLRAEGPGLPGARERRSFYVLRARGRNVRIVTIVEWHDGKPLVRGVRTSGDTFEIETGDGIDRHRMGSADWTIETAGGQTHVLRGARDYEPPFQPLIELDPPLPVVAPAFRVAAAPALDGALDAFDLSEPLQLALEDQYRRSEDAYPGPDDLSALAYAAWDEAALYIAVDVTKPHVWFRPGDAPPLRLDNEPDDIHSDGVQVYLAAAGDHAPAAGYLIVPDGAGRVRVRVTSDAAAHAAAEKVQGGWQRTETGYRVTVALPWPQEIRPHAGARVRFDLIINEMLPERLRRVGQLVWSGGGGWVWLRGDRQHPERFGVLELVV